MLLSIRLSWRNSRRLYSETQCRSYCGQSNSGLGIWLGSDIFLSFVVAPGAFSVLASRDQAGAMVGYSLARMHWMGIVCGVAILLVRVVRRGDWVAWWRRQLCVWR